MQGTDSVIREKPEASSCTDGGEAPSPLISRLVQSLGTLEVWLLYAYACSLPLSMTATWVLFIAGAAVRLILLALDKETRECSLLALRSAPLLVPLALFALCVAISGAFNSTHVYGQFGPHFLSEASGSLGTLKNLLPYLWSVVALKLVPSRCGTVMAALLMVSSIAGVWGTVQQIFNIHPGYKYLQGTGFLGGPMAYAGQMQIFSLLALSFLLSNAFNVAPDPAAPRLSAAIHRLMSKPAFMLGVVLCNYFGVIFAGERSAWLGEIAGTAALLCMHWRKAEHRRSASRDPRKTILAATAILVVCFAAIPLVTVRLQSVFTGKDVGVTARLTIWRSCLDLIPQSPVFGVGIRRFPHFDIPEAIVPGVSKDLNHAHSNYFHILTTTGFTGLTAFLGMFVTLFIAGFRSLASKIELHPVSTALTSGLMAGAVSLLVSGLFEYNFGTAQIRLAHWFLLGLL